MRPKSFALDDGDELELMWGPAPEDPDAGIVLIAHGLGGCATSHYVLGLVDRLHRAGLQALVIQLRGSGSRPNRLLRSYHAAAWHDLDAVCAGIRARYPCRRLGFCAFSISGSMLLNGLAERGGTPLDAAAVASVPFELAACADAINRGFGRVYQAYLLQRLRRLAAEKCARHPDEAPISARAALRIRTLREFDDRWTAPIHGFGDAATYYARASCRQRLHAIRQPVHILHAMDDPFVPASAVPTPSELGPGVTLARCRSGGHVGFVGGALPGRPRYWLEAALTAHMVAGLQG